MTGFDLTNSGSPSREESSLRDLARRYLVANIGGDDITQLADIQLHRVFREELEKNAVVGNVQRVLDLAKNWQPFLKAEYTPIEIWYQGNRTILDAYLRVGVPGECIEALATEGPQFDTDPETNDVIVGTEPDVLLHMFRSEVRVRKFDPKSVYKDLFDPQRGAMRYSDPPLYSGLAAYVTAQGFTKLGHHHRAQKYIEVALSNSTLVELGGPTLRIDGLFLYAQILAENKFGRDALRVWNQAVFERAQHEKHHESVTHALKLEELDQLRLINAQVALNYVEDYLESLRSKFGSAATDPDVQSIHEVAFLRLRIMAAIPDTTGSHVAKILTGAGLLIQDLVHVMAGGRITPPKVLELVARAELFTIPFLVELLRGHGSDISSVKLDLQSRPWQALDTAYKFVCFSDNLRPTELWVELSKVLMFLLPVTDQAAPRPALVGNILNNLLGLIHEERGSSDLVLSAISNILQMQISDDTSAKKVFAHSAIENLEQYLQWVPLHKEARALLTQVAVAQIEVFLNEASGLPEYDSRRSACIVEAIKVAARVVPHVWLSGFDRECASAQRQQLRLIISNTNMAGAIEAKYQSLGRDLYLSVTRLGDALSIAAD